MNNNILSLFSYQCNLKACKNEDNPYIRIRSKITTVKPAQTVNTPKSTRKPYGEFILIPNLSTIVHRTSDSSLKKNGNYHSDGGIIIKLTCMC
jgi:hypothetical protein